MEQIDVTVNKPKAILLDVYGTLLDMSEVETKVNDLFSSRRAYIKWFDLFMQYCFVDNCTSQFNDFLSIAKATMQMTADTFGKTIDNDDINNILRLLKHLKLKEGVQEGLSMLYDQGFTIAALTNSSRQTVLERMELTGLISYFKIVLSAESVKKYKPCKEVYFWAAKELDMALNEILLVSSHSWDIAGAGNVGMLSAFVKQDKQMLYPLSPRPTYICDNLTGLATQLELEMNKNKN